MAEATFCSLKDLERYEPDIQQLADKSGNINKQLGGARLEIEGNLITRLIIVNLEKLGPDIKPRQLRTPAIFKTLEMIFRTNSKDDESPYGKKADDYEIKYEKAMSMITVLDLDSDEDGTISEGEENSRLTNYTTVRRV